MAFGQPSGPPASPRQIQELLELLQGAGHLDFRDARGPMGFTQRQAAGRFTRAEADAFIRRLDGSEPEPAEQAALFGTERAQGSSPDQLLVRLPAEQLAAELRRRGWMVIEPLTP